MAPSGKGKGVDRGDDDKRRDNDRRRDDSRKIAEALARDQKKKQVRTKKATHQDDIDDDEAKDDAEDSECVEMERESRLRSM